jgi:hypothetical protein
MEQLKGASTLEALALPTNMRLAWESLPGTNTLAYYNFFTTAVKSFITLGPYLCSGIKHRGCWLRSY